MRENHFGPIRRHALQNFS